MGPTGEGVPRHAEITALLREVQAGVAGSEEVLFRLLETELHRRALCAMRGQPKGHTLQATALVAEAYLKLCGESSPWNDRRHFLMTASKAMRQVLVDHARRKAARKRSARQEDHPLDGLVCSYEDRAVDLEALDRALKRLEELDPSMARAVELRFFGGHSMAEVARVLGVAQRTLERRWQMTRAWLYQELD